MTAVFWEERLTTRDGNQYNMRVIVEMRKGNKPTDLHCEESILSECLEELAKNEVDQVNKILVWLVSRQSILFGQDCLEKV